MGIDAQLREENGEILEEVSDVGALSRAAGCAILQDTRLLKYIVPWGDAIFNQAQASDLLSDVRQVRTVNPESPLGCHLLRLEPLIAKLGSEPHLYLWFVGD